MRSILERRGTFEASFIAADRTGALSVMGFRPLQVFRQKPFWAKLLGLFLFVILVAMHAMPAHSADSAVREVEDVVVTATRTAVPRQHLGISTTVITEEDIQARRATDVAELLRDVAGFQTIRFGSPGSQTVVFPRGGEPNYTLVLIDGVQVNLGGGDFYWENLSTDNIERIEIVRGPQSALYGSDAIGGVVQIFTKSGSGPASVEVSTAHGLRSDRGRYFGEQKVRVSGGTDLFGYSAAYGRRDDGGILKINNDYWNNTFSSRFDFFPKDTWEVSLVGRLSDSRYEYPTESAGDKYSPLDPNQTQREQDVLVGVSARVQSTPWWENVVSVGYHRNLRRNLDPFNEETDFAESYGRYNEVRATVDYHANLNWKPTEAVTSVLTVGYERDQEDYAQESIYFDTTKLNADRTNDAVYVQEQLSLLSRLHLVAGFRVEDNSAFGTKVTPRGAAAFELRETGTTLRLAAAKGIKEPTFYENYANDSFTLGNPDLDPERATSWEVGLSQRLGSRLQASATYFESRYKDLIAYVPTPFPAPPERVPNFYNIQAAKSRGVELSLEGRVLENTAAGIHMTWLETEVTDDGGLSSIAFQEGKKLLRRPKFSASGWVETRWKNLHCRFIGHYVGTRDDADYRDWTMPRRVSLDDYFLLDAVVSYRVPVPAPAKDLEIFLKGTNILDADYEQVFGYSTPGAAFMLGASMKF
ncbi:TonB-dependent receptor plug domain-containing protein [Desulfosoma caldarium]|uniref:Vitamin B12 transporter n=1 Tax=Desulfosoma caldarium TaxID=610254 RepID=A0A3N1USR8_9BACT|nr:TonB-dependent receptor [Desulfosoma caldarium]ROQ93183.1 vitamin B12 transporter [Desulfosoma caldarium]